MDDDPATHATTHPLTAAEARAALEHAGAARTALAARGRWTRTYLLAFAAGSVVLVPLVGLGGPAGMTAGMALWVLLISVMVGWAQRQPVHGRDARRRQGWAWGTWTVLYGATILLGEVRFPGVPAFWLPAALVVAVPLVVWALLPPPGTAATPRVVR